MTYNKSKEDIKWLKWKEKEERILREMGVSEGVIDELRKYDEQILRKNRAYHEKEYTVDENLFLIQKTQIIYDNGDLESLMMDLKNEVIYEVMKNLDPDLYKILDLKVQGYTINEISDKLGIQIKTIYKKIERFQKNFKSIVEK